MSEPGLMQCLSGNLSSQQLRPLENHMRRHIFSPDEGRRLVERGRHGEGPAGLGRWPDVRHLRGRARPLHDHDQCQLAPKRPRPSIWHACACSARCVGPLLPPHPPCTSTACTACGSACRGSLSRAAAPRPARGPSAPMPAAMCRGWAPGRPAWRTACRMEHRLRKGLSGWLTRGGMEYVRWKAHSR